jgi:hypothetical protein
MRLGDLNLTSVIVGLIFISFGGSVAFIASGYPLGTASQMGPGYLPLAAGLILAAIGVVVLVLESFSTTAMRADPPEWRAWFFIVSSVLTFAALIETAGFLPAVLATSLVSLLANPRLKPVSALVTSVVIAALSSAIFVWGLHLNVELIKWVA